VKRVGFTFSLIVVAGVAYATPRGSSVDVVLCLVLGAVVVFGSLTMLKGAVSEWWANVDPSPRPPLLKPRYWPGSKADGAQKAARVEPREVV
jgi:hypothetical protein